MEQKIKTQSLLGFSLCVLSLAASVMVLRRLTGQTIALGAVTLMNLLGLMLSLKSLGLAARESLTAPLGVLGLLIGSGTALLDVLGFLLT